MAYATLGNVLSRYRPLHTVVGTTANQVTSLDIDSAFIADAESFINGYISNKYATPLSPVPSLITQIAADLTIFNVMAEKLPEVPDFMQARYDRSIKTLEMLRDGKMFLSNSITTISSGDSEAWSANQDYHSIFDPTLNDVDQKIDIDQVNAAKDEREGDV